MDITYNTNEDKNKMLLSTLRKKINNVKKGGGQPALDRIREKGKMTARERIDYLLDNDAQSIEIGALAAEGMYEEVGGCPSAGVVVKIGEIQNTLCIVVANDASVKSGAWFPMTAKKNLRAQEIAMENKIPIIYLVDSAGVFLPMQNEVFADKEHFGRIFRNNAVMSSMGITQIGAVMGSCVAGGAYLPVMCDESLIVDKTGSIFLAGSHLVKAAVGEIIDNETLGGATTHCEISGVMDYKCENDTDALDKIKNIIDKIGCPDLAGFNRKESQPSIYKTDDVFGLLPHDRTKAYDTKEIIKYLVDSSALEEYKSDYGKTIITAYARIDGWAVGIVANQRTLEINSQGETKFGGVIYNESADKATRFIANCNQKKIPLVFLHDVTGFMVGSKSEHSGIIKDGAKLVNAISNSIVPKFTVIIGNSYGAGNYAMCGKAYDPRLIIAWPSARIGVMGASQAAKVMLEIEKGKFAKKKKKMTAEQEKKIIDQYEQQYDAQTDPYYAAARLWVDAIISPTETRQWISKGIEMANHAPIDKKFNMGILQT